MISPHFRSVVKEQFADRSEITLDRQIDEVCKYLTIISRLDTSRFIPLTKAADEVWHEMIVQTAFYMEFCEGLPSARYVHHQSIGFDDYARSVGRESAVAQFISWVPDYVEEFGPFSTSAAQDWAVVEFLQKEVGMTLDEVNAIGRTEEAAVR